MTVGNGNKAVQFHFLEYINQIFVTVHGTHNGVPLQILNLELIFLSLTFEEVSCPVVGPRESSIDVTSQTRPVIADQLGIPGVHAGLNTHWLETSTNGSWNCSMGLKRNGLLSFLTSGFFH